jgi:hypothetical protein
MVNGNTSIEKENLVKIDKKESDEKVILEEGFGYFGSGFYRTMSAPYMVPTKIRKFYEGNYHDYKRLSKKEKRKYVSGLITGGAIDAVTLVGMGLEDPKLFLGLAATNLASLGYELGRLAVVCLAIKGFEGIIDNHFTYPDDYNPSI